MVSEQLTRDRILEAASSLAGKKVFQEVGFFEIGLNVQDALHTTIYLYFKIRMKFCLKLLVLH